MSDPPDELIQLIDDLTGDDPRGHDGECHWCGADCGHWLAPPVQGVHQAGCLWVRARTTVLAARVEAYDPKPGDDTSTPEMLARREAWKRERGI